ncbi:hypothetical protein AB0H42_19555 [Nocardia sp. NPDC050799]|uniref:hypothetical protein n=1 Tax=Nocardia sp. NPDC050799 TaxID=3154842 RepID=UPI0033E5713B
MLDRLADTAAKQSIEALADARDDHVGARAMYPEEISSRSRRAPVEKRSAVPGPQLTVSYTGRRGSLEI